MMKTQIGLGLLSIPAVFVTLGLIPGVLCLLSIAVITTWSDYTVGTFKLRRRAVYGIDDAGKLIFGRLGGEIFGSAFCLCECRGRPRYLYSLISHRLDFRRRIGNARWSECRFQSWGLHCRLRLGGSCHRLPVRIYPDPRPNLRLALSS
jgi:hypothetical protein